MLVPDIETYAAYIEAVFGTLTEIGEYLFESRIAVKASGLP
ncbi:MAG: hypothetical protein Ct9H300mP14_12820 [Gammaproteobacteria bacterium]|nr:MAG: hypothetical protein Ct9H300mP14_12820 [Gammaproteobacteria bacterium]